MSRWLHSGERRKEVSDHVCSLLLFFSLSYSIFFFWAYRNQILPTENKQQRVNPLDSSCLRVLTHLSEPARDSWNEGGCHDNSAATLLPVHVPAGEQEAGPFLPLCSLAKFVQLELANGSLKVISQNVPHSRNNQEMLSGVIFFPPIFETFLFLLTLSLFRKLCICIHLKDLLKRSAVLNWCEWHTKNSLCHYGSLLSRFSTATNNNHLDRLQVVFSLHIANLLWEQKNNDRQWPPWLI